MVVVLLPRLKNLRDWLSAMFADVLCHLECLTNNEPRL